MIEPQPVAGDDPDEVSVNITIESGAALMSDVVVELEAHGVRIDAVLEMLGIVSGRVVRSGLGDLRELPAVLTVEEDGSLGLFD